MIFRELLKLNKAFNTPMLKYCMTRVLHSLTTRRQDNESIKMFRCCAALRAAPPGRYVPHALRAQPFLEHEKKACFYQIKSVRRCGCVLTKCEAL